MAQDENPKQVDPAARVTDVSVAAERIIGVSTAAWCQPGIEDSTPESLGMSPEEVQKLHNGGFTDAELARQQGVAKGQVTR